MNNLISLAVFFIAVTIAFFVGSHIDRKRFERKMNKYPSATRRRYSKEVDWLLELDETERAISN